MTAGFSRRLPLVGIALALAALGLPATGKQPPPGGPGGTIRAGYGQADATWNVGATAGQYADYTSLEEKLSGDDVDPHAHARTKEKSYGTHSRLTARAIVVEGTDGRRIALLKTDNYLAQDLLLRRVGQLLDEGNSGVAYDDILHTATHNHSSPYYTTTSPGVWLFQDAFDQRMFEYQARAVRDAIERAAGTLRPARMAATTVPFSVMKANVVGPAIADDGTPAGYPREYGDTGLVVMRFDALVSRDKPGNGKGRGPKAKAGDPIAVWMNFGEHPESLDGYGLTTSDFLGPLERFVERDLGAPLVFSQGDVGSAEGPYQRADTMRQLPDGTWRAYAHAGYAQMERGARLMADAVVDGFNLAGTDAAQVPFSSNFPVQVVNAWVPGPVSHPYPSYGNCRAEPTYGGRPGAGTVPDCARPPTPAQDNPVTSTLKLHGVPVPEHYDQPGYPAVQENTRLRLQVFRLGEVLLASCACEAQVDLILNIESRANDVAGDSHDGYDWSEGCTPAAAGLWSCPDPRDASKTLTISDFAYRRMKAQVRNDARGWDDPAYAPYANSEPADPELIKGNFTKEELPAARGFRLPVGIGHAGDYNGYTVSYREYMSRDHYRKALTTYGPHTADYMATRLVRMAGSLKGGPALAPELNNAQAQADEARQAALAETIGRASGAAYDGWRASLPADAGPVAAITQPLDIQRFQAATFTWRGGSNAVDNPDVRVERLVDGEWTPYAGMSGEVQTSLDFPAGVNGVADAYTGRHEWKWTASFEAFDAFPARIGSTPAGAYRFVVGGVSRVTGEDSAYTLVSRAFTVSPWTGVRVIGGQVHDDGSVSFAVPDSAYPRTYASPAFPTIRDDNGVPICRTCSFRPWAASGHAVAATVTVTRADGTVSRVAATLVGGRWVAATALAPGDRAEVRPGDVLDNYGETNATGLVLIA